MLSVVKVIFMQTRKLKKQKFHEQAVTGCPLLFSDFMSFSVQNNVHSNVLSKAVSWFHKISKKVET